MIKCFRRFPAQQFLSAKAKEMGTVCDMTLNNIVDLYLFDDQASVILFINLYPLPQASQLVFTEETTTFFAPQDTFSCPNQCTNLEACNFYTSYIRDGIHKCFLFKACDNPEECELCDTVPV